MADVFKNSAAPYVLALMVSLLGWMFTTMIKSGENIWIIQYSVAYGSSDGVPTATVMFENKSLLKPLNTGGFTIECSDEKYDKTADLQCFQTIPQINSPVQPVGTGGVVLSSLPSKVDHKAMRALALLPPGVSAGYRFGLVEAETKLRIFYTPANPLDGTRMVLTDDWTLEGFVFSNYFRIISVAFFGLLLLIAIWFVIELVGRLCAPSANNVAKKKAIKLTVEVEGNKYVGTGEIDS